MLSLAARSRVLALRAVARGLDVPPRLSPSQWAGEYRWLSPKSSAQPGKWISSRIPFLNAIMDALDPLYPAALVTFMKSAQVGGSETGLCWLGWIMHQCPNPTLVLMPGEKTGLKWVRGRFRPMIVESPVLNAMLPIGRSSVSSNTLTEVHFPGGVLYVGSANIPSDLAMVPICFLLLDEIDRMPRSIDGEGDPTELAMRRLATYVGRSKAFKISTPTDEGSPIDKSYQVSSRGRYFVPCPHCNEKQVLRWPQLKYVPGQEDDCAYECEHCALPIKESSKPWMMVHGEWRHEKPELCSTHIGFHINCLYTPIGLGDSWADNARAYEIALGDPAKMQVFVNTRLGEVHHAQRIKLNWEIIAKRREEFPLRKIPKGILLLTAGVDFQGNRAEVQVMGWGRDNKRMPIDYLVLLGQPTDSDMLAKLQDYLTTPFANSFGVDMPISCSLLDAGFAQTEILQFVWSVRGKHIYASRGSTVLTREPIGRPKKIDVKRWGAVDHRGADLYWLGVGELKRIIYQTLKADDDATPSERLIRFSKDLPDAYFKQLAAEYFDGSKRKWVLEYERNEALDTMVYATAASMHHSMGVHRFKDADWRRLEEQFEPAVAAAVIEKPKLSISGGFMPTRAMTKGDDE